jgi:hypothetical protein
MNISDLTSKHEKEETQPRRKEKTKLENRMKTEEWFE